ncbi:hypothetical protein SpCBS45565_g07972 [Spizellomyces sp. 'palustris']|nr:hypothetical protein SpCBS45565_g07972 [Spizellomyces sp. 'palustris']
MGKRITPGHEEMGPISTDKSDSKDVDLESGRHSPHIKIGESRPSTASSTVTYNSEDFRHPPNAVEIDPKHKPAVKVFGRVGFIAKSIIYGVLGGLLIRNAAGGGEDSSPQGVFILVGDNAVGIPLLIVLAAALVFYCIWRFWEAFRGQGSDATFSRKKNFFKYRVSPFVSGAVYAAYTYYVIRTIFTNRSQRDAQQGTEITQSSFPDSWSSSGSLGKFGVSFFGLIFLLATFIQFQVAYTGTFKRDLYQNRLQNKWIRWLSESLEFSIDALTTNTEITTVHGLGHIGFTARGLVFLLVAILMFRSAAGGDEASADKNHTVTGKAVEALTVNWWGRTILVLLGVGLLLYALFALSNVYYKIFPTPPPSRKPAISDEPQEEPETSEAHHRPGTL